MTAQATTKLQVNYKLADGTLINVYGDSIADLSTQLAGIISVAETITEAGKVLGGSNAVATLQAGLGATVVAASQTAAPVAEGHCKHGALVWRESKPGAPKPWKGWFCPSPKGTPDQCEPKFVR
jgi:hypothetical protein